MLGVSARCDFDGAADGIETLLVGSFIPPVLEFISERYGVFLFRGVSSLSTSTNSISFIFGFGLSNKAKFIPKNASIRKASHAAPKTDGCKIVEITMDFFKVNSSLSSRKTAGVV